MTNILNSKLEKVMIIDDNQIDIFIASRMIHKHSVAEKIITYTDANEALIYLIENQYDTTALPEVILLDIMMPLMNGFEFMQKYEQLGAIIKNYCNVYIVSSSIDRDDIQRAKEDKNVIGFQVKPINNKFIDSIAILPVRKQDQFHRDS
jgi:CheY-like chemotaxis protein